MNSESVLNLRRILLDPVAWRLSKSELHEFMKRRDTDEIINTTKEYTGRGFYASIHAIQRFAEIAKLTRLVEKARPKVIVEIGTAKGGTLYIWARTNPEVELIVSLDLPDGDFGGGYDQRRVKLYREFVHDRPNTKMELLRCDSHAPSSAEQLKAILGGRQIDFLYIDGDHVYEGVKMDFEVYSKFVRKGGIVAFHDIVTTGNGHDVSRFWNEVKQRHPYEEFIENPTGSMGIGVLHL